MITQINLLPDVASDRMVRGIKMKCEATFSHCQRYRYELWRKWDMAKPYANFLMLNPSTATAELDDPTILRCIGYALDWGYGAMCVTNIFAFRATIPMVMKREVNPIGIFNDATILQIAKAAGIVVCAWGTHGAHLNRGADVLHRLKDTGVKPQTLALTEGGFPGHPLYLKKSLQPFPMP